MANHYDRYHSVRSKGWVSYKGEGAMRYKDFFSTKVYRDRWVKSGGKRGGSEKILVASGRYKNRMGMPVGKRDFISLLQRGEGGLKVFTRANPKDKRSFVIQGSRFGEHFTLFRNAVDLSLWGFVQAMGSHKQRVFEESFDAGKKGFQTGFRQPRRWPALSKITKNNRRRLGFSVDDNMVRTGRLRGAVDFKNNTNQTYPGASVFISKKPFEDYYPEFPLTNKRKKSPSGDIGVTNFKDPYGRYLLGRRRRFYGYFHNEGAGNPQRQFIGIESRLTDIEDKLMDQLLFYSVFNRYLGVS